MSEILFPTTLNELTMALSQVLKDFSATAFNGQPVSGHLHPGILTTQGVMDDFRKRPPLQTLLASQLPCPQHRLEISWSTEPVTYLRQSSLQLPPHAVREGKLQHPSILIRPPAVKH